MLAQPAPPTAQDSVLAAGSMELSFKAASPLLLPAAQSGRMLVHGVLLTLLCSQALCRRK